MCYSSGLRARGIYRCYKLTFSVGSKYLQPGIKGSSKSNKKVAITGGH